MSFVRLIGSPGHQNRHELGPELGERGQLSDSEMVTSLFSAAHPSPDFDVTPGLAVFG